MIREGPADAHVDDKETQKRDKIPPPPEYSIPSRTLRHRQTAAPLHCPHSSSNTHPLGRWVLTAFSLQPTLWRGRNGPPNLRIIARGTKVALMAQPLSA